MNALELRRILCGSKIYSISDDGVLTITGYHSGETVHLDLVQLTDDMLDDLIVAEEDLDEE